MPSLSFLHMRAAVYIPKGETIHIYFCGISTCTHPFCGSSMKYILAFFNAPMNDSTPLSFERDTSKTFITFGSAQCFDTLDGPTRFISASISLMFSSSFLSLLYLSITISPGEAYNFFWASTEVFLMLSSIARACDSGVLAVDVT